MPNVLFVSECTGITGGARQFLALAKGLRAKDWDVAIACPGGAETFQTAVEMGLPTVDFVPRQDYDVFSALRLARLISERRIDVLHAHHARAHAVGLMAAKLSRRPVAFLVTRRVSFPPSKNFFSKLKYTSSRIDSFVAVAESIRKTLIEGGVAPDRIVTIPSGVDLERFSPRPKDAGWAGELKLPRGVPVVGLVAHYGTWKGHEVFLKAAGILKKEGTRAVYLIAGRETDSETVRALASQAGLAPENVRLLGFQEDIPAILSLFDVSVSASTSGEGLSGAARESLAMGIPVVVSDVGGNRELVVDGKTGLVFQPGDAEGLARALKQTLSDTAKAHRLAAAGREEVRKRLSVERMVESTAALYRTLLRRRGVSPEALERAA